MHINAQFGLHSSINQIDANLKHDKILAMYNNEVT